MVSLRHLPTFGQVAKLAGLRGFEHCTPYKQKMNVRVNQITYTRSSKTKG